MPRYFLTSNGEEKKFAHECDALEWVAAGLVTAGSKPEPRVAKSAPVKEEAPAPAPVVEEVKEEEPAEEAPKKRAPRRRAAE